jgi:hypothetical protein
MASAGLYVRSLNTLPDSVQWDTKLQVEVSVLIVFNIILNHTFRALKKRLNLELTIAFRARSLKQDLRRTDVLM